METWPNYCHTGWHCGHATHDADWWKLREEKYKNFISGKRKADHYNHDHLTCVRPSSYNAFTSKKKEEEARNDSTII